MAMHRMPAIDELFERRLSFPDFEPQERLAKLVGLDDHKARLSKILSLLVNPAGLDAWVQKHHPEARGLLKHVLRRPPLVVLAGDVGSGMTQLLSAAFDYTVEAATPLKSTSGRARGAIILLVDEADALAQSRESAQMHHEDRAGVNAFIRGIDRLANGQLPAAVIMCTNRLGALDPAVKRRAADTLSFDRPDDAQRRAVLSGALQALGLTIRQIDDVVAATGKSNGRPRGFTFSDLTQRLLPAIVLDAYPSRGVDHARTLEITRSMQPTPPFEEQKP